MDGYLAASIPDSGAWFPENDVTAALDRQIMAGLVNGWRSIVNNSSAPQGLVAFGLASARPESPPAAPAE